MTTPLDFLCKPFGNTSTSTSSNQKIKRLRGRVSRIEELESRELLSVTPWSLADGSFADCGDTNDVAEYTEGLASPALASTTALVSVAANPLLAADKTEQHEVLAAAPTTLTAVKGLKLDGKTGLTDMGLKWSHSTSSEVKFYEVQVFDLTKGKNNLVRIDTIVIEISDAGSDFITALGQNGKLRIDKFDIDSTNSKGKTLATIKLAGLSAATSYRIEVRALCTDASSNPLTGPQPLSDESQLLSTISQLSAKTATTYSAVKKLKTVKGSVEQTRMDLSWQHSMKFDGTTAYYEVVVKDITKKDQKGLIDTVVINLNDKQNGKIKDVYSDTLRIVDFTLGSEVKGKKLATMTLYGLEAGRKYRIEVVAKASKAAPGGSGATIPDDALCSKTAAISVKTKTGNAVKLNQTSDNKPATDFTAENNALVYMLLDFDDEQEREFAERGFLIAPPALELFDDGGNMIWSQKAFAFVEGTDAPDSANPSLWRHTQLNHLYGLFEVVKDHIYQVRGYDLSNITFVKGNTGWIVFDPLSNIETAKAALNLINVYFGEDRPVMGVVISHCHADHFGGIKGVCSEDDAIPIIVPEGFEHHAVSENVYAGNAMLRRSDYMYGRHLEPGEQGRLAVGLGVGVPSGTSSYISPTDIITTTGTERTIDGVKMVFQMTPGTEAPAEMNTWFPDLKAFWAAENCTGTLHNLYTLRGAQVRDGNAWAGFIMEAVSLYGDEVEVVFQAHNWPHWGNAVINEYLVNTAAMYKFINDQTLMYLNQGYTANEIANMIRLPEALEKVWYTRQYYGTLIHDAKAVYQRFMGWYDANPVNLNPLTPEASAKKFVEYMGDPLKVLEMAKKDFDKGEYQWVAQITNILVFNDPTNMDARYLCADALEQLGYQSESGVWRAVYLTGAKELREGTPTSGLSGGSGGDMIRAMEPTMIFDYMGIHLDSNAAQNLNLKINFDIWETLADSTTVHVYYCVTVRAGVLLYQEKETIGGDVDATITLPRQAMALLLTPNASENPSIVITGDSEILDKLNEHMVEFNPYFNIVEP